MKIIIHFSVCAIVLLTVACKHEVQHQEEVPSFAMTSPIRLDTVIYDEFVCQIHAIQRIELRALEKGYLQNIYVDEGEHVKKGQLMFRIMPTIYQAELQKAKAEVNFAQIEYQNSKNLAESNVISSSELALAKAKLDKASAEMDLAQTHLNFTEIRAPFDGIMDHFHVRLGSMVDEGELLTTLSDNSKVWVYFNVHESAYLDYVGKSEKEKMDKVKLRLANGKEFPYTGIVETIEADFNNETGNIPFRATFPNPKGLLRHGQTGDILLPVQLNNALIIPQKATFEVLDKKYVYVKDRNNKLQAREISIQTEIPHLYIVSGGIGENDVILIEGLKKVKNGEEVKGLYEPMRKVMTDLLHLHAE